MNSIPVCILVGVVLGFLTGLGIGGGSLLILWLTQVLHTPQQQAQGINLLFFLPAALVACLLNGRRGRLNWSLAIPAMLLGALGAGLAAWLATGLPEGSLGRVFGLLLLASGLWELLGVGRRKKHPR